MTTPLTKELYPEHDTVLKTAHDWQEYIKRYKQRNGSRLPVAIAVPTKVRPSDKLFKLEKSEEN